MHFAGAERHLARVGVDYKRAVVIDIHNSAPAVWPPGDLGADRGTGLQVCAPIPPPLADEHLGRPHLTDRDPEMGPRILRKQTGRPIGGIGPEEVQATAHHHPFLVAFHQDPADLETVALDIIWPLQLDCNVADRIDRGTNRQTRRQTEGVFDREPVCRKRERRGHGTGRLPPLIATAAATRRLLMGDNEHRYRRIHQLPRCQILCRWHHIADNRHVGCSHNALL